MGLENTGEALAQTLCTGVQKRHTENTREIFYWPSRDDMYKSQRFVVCSALLCFYFSKEKLYQTLIPECHVKLRLQSLLQDQLDLIV